MDGTFRYKQYETVTQNYQKGVVPDGRSGILVVTQEGKPTGKNTLGNSFPLNLYYAYGIRNSFGIDWDPVTGYLWDSENGPNFGDELNLVQPGFNSGWARVQGYWKPDVEKMGPLNLNPDDLVSFDGHGTYSLLNLHGLIQLLHLQLNFWILTNMVLNTRTICWSAMPIMGIFMISI